MNERAYYERDVGARGEDPRSLRPPGAGIARNIPRKRAEIRGLARFHGRESKRGVIVGIIGDRRNAFQSELDPRKS